MTTPTNEIKIRGRIIRQDENGFVSVTDIHKAAGFTVNQKPADFIRLPQALAILPIVHEKTMGKSHSFKMSNVWKAVGGRNGGTYAHPLLALAYSEYLSPTLAVEVKEVFLRHRSGDATLADETLQRSTPEGNEWAAKRAMGRVIRNQYTNELGARGVEIGWQFGTCTNETYIGLFGATAKKLKAERGIPANGNLRDKMTMAEIAFIAASEALSVERMADVEAFGYGECKTATARASAAIRNAIESDRKDRQRRLG